KETAVEWKTHFNKNAEHPRTEENRTNYNLELARPSWWAEQNLPTIQVNDTLKVEDAIDDGHEIQAFTVWINGGNAIVLRTGEMPPWSEGRSGHTGEDHENEAEAAGSD